VKRALIEHLELDAKVTLGVLCDQLAPADSTMDEEEQNIRARLRDLVLDFLTTDVFAAACDPKSVMEGDLVESVLGVRSMYIFITLCTLTKSKVLPHLEHADVAKVVKVIIQRLPSFKGVSPRGEALLSSLLSRVSEAMRQDLASTMGPGQIHLLKTRIELRLAQQLVIEDRVAPSPPLLLYYAHHLTRETFLQRVESVDQEWLIVMLAELLLFCQKNYPSDPEILRCLWRIVDATPFLLEVRFNLGLGLKSILTLCW